MRANTEMLGKIEVLFFQNADMPCQSGQNYFPPRADLIHLISRADFLSPPETISPPAPRDFHLISARMHLDAT